VKGEVSAVHPAYRITERDTVTLQFNGDRIQPRAATYRMGQSLVFQSVFGDTHGPVFPWGRVSAVLPPGASMAVGVPGTKILPQHISCVIHPQARAYLKILDPPLRRRHRIGRFGRATASPRRPVRGAVLSRTGRLSRSREGRPGETGDGQGADVDQRHAGRDRSGRVRRGEGWGGVSFVEAWE
jgi:hypothetical protein